MWYTKEAKTPSMAFNEKALAYQQTLTKPPGSLGVLEDLAVRFSAMQQTIKPTLDNVYIAIMAGDHGIAAQGVSAFPQAVTVEMIKNFARGGAAISVLAKHLQATLQVVNTGTVSEVEALPTVLDRSIAKGTKDFSQEPAMSVEQCEKALAVGQEQAGFAFKAQAQLFIGGEMGIANTSAASCILAKLLHCGAVELTGPGTGLDEKGVSQKAKILQKALELHNVNEPLTVLQTFGGFEIAALTGSFIAAAQKGIPVLVDGFITTAAALLALKINPSIKPWLIVSHQSAEPGHQKALQALGLAPVVSLGMRLGEGSGAATVVPLLQMACRLQSEMASFEEAGVSQG